MKDIIITTALRQQNNIKYAAKKLADDYNIPYIERGKDSINKLYTKFNVPNIFIVDHELNLIFNRIDNPPIIYHPGMAIIRIKRLQVGNNDYMIDLLDVKKEDTLLDCTVGLASDAIVFQYVASNGLVTGLEKNKLLALFIKHGLQNFKYDNIAIIEAMQKIKVVNCDHNKFLLEAKDKSYDYVYFDPMFTNTVEKSISMQMFSSYCNKDTITESAIENAKRVARKKVVIKERTFSKLFDKLGFTKIYRSNASFSYGIIDVT